MPVDGPSRWDQEACERVVERLGSYARAVARALLDADVPARDGSSKPGTVRTAGRRDRGGSGAEVPDDP